MYVGMPAHALNELAGPTDLKGFRVRPEDEEGGRTALLS